MDKGFNQKHGNKIAIHGDTSAGIKFFPVITGSQNATGHDDADQISMSIGFHYVSN